MKSATWTFDLLRLVFHNVNASLIGDQLGLAGSETGGNLYISLHKSDPAMDGAQNSDEASFGGYVRLAVPRTSSKWSVEQDSDNITCKVNNMTELAFPEATKGDEQITHVGIGALKTGTGKLLYSGELKEPRTVSNGIILSFKPGQITLIEK